MTKSLPQQSETVVTYWKCERCLRTGSVTLDRHAGVWEGFDAVQDAHDAEATFGCDGGMRDIRVQLGEST